MRNHVTHQVTRARSTLRSSLNRSAEWVSRRTFESERSGALSQDASFSFRSSYSAWNGFSLALDDETIWLDQGEEERVFDEKLHAFLETEDGRRPDRAWLLKDS